LFYCGWEKTTDANGLLCFLYTKTHTPMVDRGVFFKPTGGSKLGCHCGSVLGCHNQTRLFSDVLTG